MKQSEEKAERLAKRRELRDQTGRELAETRIRLKELKAEWKMESEKQAMEEKQRLTHEGATSPWVALSGSGWRRPDQSGLFRFKWFNNEPRDCPNEPQASPLGGSPSALHQRSPIGPSIETLSRVHTRTVRGVPKRHLW